MLDPLGGATFQGYGSANPTPSGSASASPGGDSVSPQDAVEAYFECITSCSLDDGECITTCTEILRDDG
jgi:hypothetical protein